jgi:hypothetical protein
MNETSSFENANNTQENSFKPELKNSITSRRLYLIGQPQCNFLKINYCTWIFREAKIINYKKEVLTRRQYYP